MIGEEKILPKDWKWEKLGKVAAYLNGRAFKPTEWKDSGKPIIRIQNLNKPDAKYNYTKVEFEERYKVAKGDLLFAWSASLGAYIWKGDEAWLNQHIFKVVPKDFTDKTYLFYLLEKIVQELYAKAHGSGMVHVTKSKFEATEIPFPPKPTQQAIVSKIEELFSELDKGIENLRTAQQQLKIYRQSVLKWAFDGKLTNENVKEGELPKGWKLTPLGDYIDDISSGKSYRCDERPPKKGEVGIVKVSSVTWGFFDEMESKTCFSIELLNKKYLIKKGDFLFSRANTIEFIGACVLVKKIEKTLMLSDKILRFIFTKDVSKEYALYYLRSRKGRKQIEKLSTGNQDSMRNIGQEKIRQIEFPYCPIKEQRNIVQAIESRLSVADKMEESITQSLQQAEALRQSILKRAFEGKLLPTETQSIEFTKVKVIPIERKVLAAKIIHLNYDKKHFGLTKFQKLFYLIENFAEIGYETNFLKETAGPYDREFTQDFRKEMKAKGWFDEEQKGSITKFSPGENVGSLISAYAKHFRDKSKKIIFVLQQLQEKNTHESELIATLYAVWNNRLIKKQPVKINLLVEDFFNWSAKKKEEFHESELIATYNWMKKVQLIPTGFGKAVELTSS